MKGVVKMFHAEKGFGFIKVDGQKEEVFFHASQLDASGFAGERPAQGETLEFEVEQGDRGPRAVKISRVG